MNNCKYMSEIKKEKVVGKGPYDLVGRKFGISTVLEETFDKEKGMYNLKMLCRCGKEFIALRRYKSYIKSCGCLVKQNYKNMGHKNRRYSQTVVTRQYHNHKNGAYQMGLVALSKEDWAKIVYKPCHYCNKIDKRDGLRANVTGQVKEDLSMTPEEREKYILSINGIDRVDNLKGYTLDNCVPCCKNCNRMKANLTKEDFLQHISDIYKYKLSH